MRLRRPAPFPDTHTHMEDPQRWRGIETKKDRETLPILTAVCRIIRDPNGFPFSGLVALGAGSHENDIGYRSARSCLPLWLLLKVACNSHSNWDPAQCQ